MSTLFLIEFCSVKDPAFKEALTRASIRELEQSFELRAVAGNTEKCCKIYAELHRKRHSKVI